MNSLTTTMERKAELSNTTPQRHTGLRAVATKLSLANVDAAICELYNEALSRMMQLAYEQDTGGLCNVDVATGKLLIPLPWGRNGAAQWGLKPTEADVLRQLLFDWQEQGKALFLYDRTRKSWFLNMSDYANAHLAKGWLTRNQVTVGLYRAARSKRLEGA